jgi:hypothetical protein
MEKLQHLASAGVMALTVAILTPLSHAKDSAPVETFAVKTFQVTSLSNLTSATVSSAFRLNNDGSFKEGFDIRSFSLFSGASPSATASPLQVESQATTTEGSGRRYNETWTLSGIQPLSAGQYTLKITGYGDAKASGISWGQQNLVQVSAVPEPETYAMLLAGLGVLCIARRKAIFSKLRQKTALNHTVHIFMPA